ncbi:PGF-pre-PGF domain-containing protein, partial [Halobium palmae]
MQSWAALELSPQGSEADVTTANVSFTVTKDALNASGVAAEDVTVMYESNGSWEEADATVSDEDDSKVTFAATVPADATLAVGVPGDGGASSEDGGNETTTTEGNESTGNETTSDETTSDETTSDEGAAQGETETGTESGGESGTTGDEGAAQGETETGTASGGESGT